VKGEKGKEGEEGKERGGAKENRERDARQAEKLSASRVLSRWKIPMLIPMLAHAKAQERDA
jgi:hypothetical protein